MAHSRPCRTSSMPATMHSRGPAPRMMPAPRHFSERGSASCGRNLRQKTVQPCTAGLLSPIRRCANWSSTCIGTAWSFICRGEQIGARTVPVLRAPQAVRRAAWRLAHSAATAGEPDGAARIGSVLSLPGYKVVWQRFAGNREARVEITAFFAPCNSTPGRGSLLTNRPTTLNLADILRCPGHLARGFTHIESHDACGLRDL